ncbi:MAG TPA: D-aminoacyl-tRNA deacylase [Candidatus Dormibacteraeota bacterium]
MRLVVQRVTSGSVTWSEFSESDPGRRVSAHADEQHVATIGTGYVLLVGAGADDDEATVRRLADKVIDMRVFADEAGRMNLSLVDVHGSALIVSQFTLFADLSRGRRPSLLGAGDPKRAEELYLAFVQRFREREIETKMGSFGAVMTVAIENDGPVTLVLSSDDWPTRV